MILQDQTLIEAPPERIFEFFAHIGENYVAWHPDHVVFRWTKGKGLEQGVEFWGRGMHPDTAQYNDTQEDGAREICHLLAREIDRSLPEAENRIWHAHPVWFLDGNPIVGYKKLKHCVRLLFWSGQSFGEEGLTKEGSFKAAEARFTAVDQVNVPDLERWLAKARDIQWDYRNIVRRKGRLERLK